MTSLEVKATIACPHHEWKVMAGDEVLPSWEIINPIYDHHRKDHQCEELTVLREFRGLKCYFIKGEPKKEEEVMLDYGTAGTGNNHSTEAEGDTQPPAPSSAGSKRMGAGAEEVPAMAGDYEASRDGYDDTTFEADESEEKPLG